MDAYVNEVVRYLVAQSWQIALLTVEWQPSRSP
jgi:hypothetical protein